MEAFEKFRVTYQREEDDRLPCLYSAQDMARAYTAGQQAQREVDAKLIGDSDTEYAEELAAAIRRQEQG